MKPRLTAKTIKEALIREPKILNLLSKEERDLAEAYFIRNEDLSLTPDYLAKLKRAVSGAAIQFVAEGKHAAIDVDPSKVWKDDDTMKSYLQEWLNVGTLIHYLQEKPNAKMRDIVVQSLFNFHAKYNEVEKFITNHEYMLRWEDEC